MKLLHFTNSLTFDVKIMFRLRACVHGHGFVRACVHTNRPLSMTTCPMTMSMPAGLCVVECIIIIYDMVLVVIIGLSTSGLDPPLHNSKITHIISF